MNKYEGYDEAIIGPAMIWRDLEQVNVLVYDAEKIREILMRDGCSAEEAREFIEFNIEGAYLGIDTPVLRIPEETPDDKPETVFWIGFNSAFSSCFRTVAILITPRVSFSVFFLMPLDLSQDQTG